MPLWQPFWAELTPLETALIALCVAAVLALELVNSAIERAVDKPDTTHWWTAGAARDMAGRCGARHGRRHGDRGPLRVLAAAEHAVGGALTLRPPRPAGLVLTLIIFYKFIFRSSNSTEKGKQPNGKTDS